MINSRLIKGKSSLSPKSFIKKSSLSYNLPSENLSTAKQASSPSVITAIASCSPAFVAITFCFSVIFSTAFILSRNFAASSKSRFSAALFIFSVITPMTSLPPFFRNSIALLTLSLYSSSVTFPQHTPIHCFI